MPTKDAANEPMSPPNDTPTEEPSDGELVRTMRNRASDIVSEAGDVARNLPEKVDRAAQVTEQMMGDAQRRLEARSDEKLLAGTSLTAGFALGLLVGRSPRFLVWMALLPAAAMGATLAARWGRPPWVFAREPRMN